MADRSNYADKAADKNAYQLYVDRCRRNAVAPASFDLWQELQTAPPQQSLTFDHRARTYTPAAGENDEGVHSQLVDNSSGDWSWKPARDRALGYGPTSKFQPFRGIPAGAAELHRAEAFPRS